MDKILLELALGVRSGIFRLLENLGKILVVTLYFVVPESFLKSLKSNRNSLAEEAKNGIRRRKATDAAKPYFVMPHNLFETLDYGLELSENGPCLGFRAAKNAKYQWLSYQTVIDRSANFGAGLLTLGAKSDCEYLVGIFAKSCVEWTLAEYGCFAYGMATAPLYDSLGQEACQETVEKYGIEIMVCGSDEQVKALMNGENFPINLRTIITIDQLSVDLVGQIESKGIKLLTVAQVEEIGSLNPHPLCPAPSDSLASLIFTSGTTGAPKGAMLTHAHFFLATKSFLQSCHPFRFNSEDTALAIFPLAHIFERLLEKAIHLHGGKVGYLSGDISGMLKDAKELRPTYFVFVPRLMNRLYDQIQADLRKNPIRRVLGKIGLFAKQRDMRNGIFRMDSIWDAVLFRKYQHFLGGNIRGGLTGSAATDGTVLNFIRAVFGCYVFELYGQTEACGPISATKYGDCSIGQVGVPCVDVEIKLVDVPEMGYFAENQCGEICSRSKFTMRGYYRMPEKTAETLDQDGWLHTGDIGMWNQEGNLKVFDRKKHIFKLSQGEYLAPERIENVFSRSSLITNIFVDGDSKYPYPVALIFPNYDAFQISEDQSKAKNGRKSPHETYILEKIFEDLTRLAKESKLKSYEIPKKIKILEEAFSVENACLTPSQKTRREVVRTIYRDHLKNLYKSD